MFISAASCVVPRRQRVHVTYYTDPVCARSWVAAPVVRRVRESYPDLRWRTCLGGLVENRSRFLEMAGAEGTDEFVDRWTKMSDRHDFPIDSSVWAVDPPISSHPMNRAVLAVDQLDDSQTQRFLRSLREGIMLERTTFQDLEELEDRAGGLPALDGRAVRETMETSEVYQRLLDDFHETRRPERDAADVKSLPSGDERYSFPALVFETDDDRVSMTQYHSFEEYAAAIERLDPDLSPADPPTAADLLDRYATVNRLETREVAEIRDESVEEAREDLAAAGATRAETSVGEFWRRG